MVYKKLISCCFYSLCYMVCCSQSIRHSAKVDNAFCSSYTNNYKKQDIVDKGLLKSEPFNSVLHISFKRKDDIKHYGTASFVSENVLVTARHILDLEENLEYLELNIPASNNQWVRLNKKDYQIFYYTPSFKKREDDIALLKIINTQKLKLLYRGHFDLTDHINNTTGKEVNISGFPFFKFAINSMAPDTLLNRSFSDSLLQFNVSKTLIGLPVGVCNGDSGGPLWIKSANHYFILGVCGSATSEGLEFHDPHLNVFTAINNNVLTWINSIK